MSSELEMAGVVRKGDKGIKVKRVQEWLSLNAYHVAIDADFGTATDTAVREFQADKGLAGDGEVGETTFPELVAPLKSALAPIAPGGRTLGELVVAYAQQHLAQHPREIGGDNKGPWVRTYMAGHEGAEWKWCAGFVCFCLQQACTALGASRPIKPSFSCDSLAWSAQQNGVFLPKPSAADRSRIRPGSFLLVQKTSTDWRHVAIVVKAEAETIKTIEGNTNDEGSDNGYEVCARTRNYGQKDFILI